MKGAIYAILLIVTINSSMGVHKIVLDGLRSLDGLFIREHDLERIYVFKMQLQKIMGVLNESECTKDTLQHIKKEIMHLAKDFFSHEPHVKPLVNKLIQEECAKRNNNKSLLLKWCEAQHGHELLQVFDNVITSVELLNEFTKDLIHFLEDIIESCPLAEAALKEKIKKWNAFKAALINAENQGTVNICKEDRSLFLQYIKYEVLSHISLSDCTSEHIVPLVNEFYAKRCA